jgi:hypothetical protein
MQKSRNDPYKRKCAQALNHQAAAVLDVNVVYEVFTQQVEKLQMVVDASKDPKDQANLERYQRYTEALKSIMMGVAATREHLLMLVNELWNLDEDSIRVYMG